MSQPSCTGRPWTIESGSVIVSNCRCRWFVYKLIYTYIYIYAIYTLWKMHKFGRSRVFGESPTVDSEIPLRTATANSDPCAGVDSPELGWWGGHKVAELQHEYLSMERCPKLALDSWCFELSICSIRDHSRFVQRMVVGACVFGVWFYKQICSSGFVPAFLLLVTSKNWKSS